MENIKNVLNMKLMLILIGIVITIPFVYASNDIPYFVVPLTNDGVPAVRRRHHSNGHLLELRNVAVA